MLKQKPPLNATIKFVFFIYKKIIFHWLVCQLNWESYQYSKYVQIPIRL